MMLNWSIMLGLNNNVQCKGDGPGWKRKGFLIRAAWILIKIINGPWLVDQNESEGGRP